MKDLHLHFQCWVEVTKQNRYRDKWLTDETYFRAIKAQVTTLGDSFNRGLMNRAISLCGGTQLDDFLNRIGVGCFVGKERALISLATPRDTYGDTMSQDQDIYWSAPLMERGVSCLSYKTISSMMDTVWLAI
jgi:hypothetical protein